MALQLMQDVPMSLSDVHFLCPFDYEEFAKQLGANITYTSVDQDWGHGDRLIVDFRKRLTNAMGDKDLPANVDRLLDWLNKTIPYASHTEFSGANIIYELTFEA